MITYDSNSIYSRTLNRLKQDANWDGIATEGSVVSALVRAEAEALAEVGRYSEYLFKESKWDTAQNPNSILSMAGILGYQPARAKSASGQIYVSADSRIHSVGSEISRADFEALLREDGTSTIDAAEWLTPNIDLTIYPNSVITDSSGKSYVVSSSTTLEKGAYAVPLTIIQGKLAHSKVLTIDNLRRLATTSKLDPCLYIPVLLPNCEDASTPLTRNFFKVTAYMTNVSSGIVTAQEYAVVNSLLLTDASEYAVEVYNDLYNSELFFLKFINDPSKGRTLDLSSQSPLSYLQIDYLETAGTQGNIPENFRCFTIDTVYKDPSAGTQTQIKLYGINLSPFVNGKDSESISEIKANAPKYYIKNYSIGTREAYENSILNTTLTCDTRAIVSMDSDTIDLTPKKVRVYGGYDSEDDRQVRKTKISFIADGLEDIVTSYETDNTQTVYDSILKALNSYLDKLKSPQDILKFEAPNFVNFAIGLDVELEAGIPNSSELISEIRDYIDSLWGSKSDALDFGRAFKGGELIPLITSEFKDKGLKVVNDNIVVEAVTKLNWLKASRPNPRPTDTEKLIHTLRVPFSFDSLFLGADTTKGFKDTNNNSYIMRIDFLFKKPSNLAGLNANSQYNTSIFLYEKIKTRTLRPFYFIQEGSQDDRLWNWTEDTLGTLNDYTELVGVTSLTSPTMIAYQYDYAEKIYSSSQFQQLITSDAERHVKNPGSLGYIRDILVYFSGNYNTGSERIGDGWIEINFESVYKVLNTFKYYDVNLRTALEQCPLATLKCNTAETSQDAVEVFEQFKTILNKYVDVYVSMQPIDSILKISQTSDLKNTVLLIDSNDESSIYGNNIQNLTLTKKPRMISINTSIEES